jgi:hypothetical protein
VLNSLRSFFKLFVGTLLAIAGIVGLYLGAVTVSLEWVFWAAIVIALMVAGITRIVPALFRAYQKIRAFPGLVRQNAAYKADLDSKDQTLTNLKSSLQDAQERGVAEGRAQVMGIMLAASAPNVRIVAIATVDGEVVLIGESDSEPRVGSRFHVIDSATGQMRGSVEVRSFDAQRSSIFLHCVDPVNVRFWEALLDRADADTSPPHGTELAPYFIADLPGVIEPAELVTDLDEAQPEEPK